MSARQRVKFDRKHSPELASLPLVDDCLPFDRPHALHNRQQLVNKFGYSFTFTTMSSKGEPVTYGRSLTMQHLPAILLKDTLMPVPIPTLFAGSAGAADGATDVTGASLTTCPVAAAAAGAGAGAAAAAASAAGPVVADATVTGASLTTCPVAAAAAGAGAGAAAASADGPVVADATVTGGGGSCAAAVHPQSDFKCVTVSIDGISTSETFDKVSPKRQTSETCDRVTFRRQTTIELGSLYVPKVCICCHTTLPFGWCFRCDK